MKILIYGPKARYDLYLPDYVKQLPVELVFCTSRRPTPEEVEILKQTFSRQGFTDGYFMNQKGTAMFGTRQEEKEPRELYAQARTTYENNAENRKEPVRMYALI